MLPVLNLKLIKLLERYFQSNVIVFDIHGHVTSLESKRALLRESDCALRSDDIVTWRCDNVNAVTAAAFIYNKRFLHWCLSIITLAILSTTLSNFWLASMISHLPGTDGGGDEKRLR